MGLVRLPDDRLVVLLAEHVFGPDEAGEAVTRPSERTASGRRKARAK